MPRRAEGRAAADDGQATGERAVAAGDAVRVAVHHLDLIRMDTQSVGGDLGQGRLHALPDRRAAAVQRDASAPIDLHPRVLPGSEARLLDERREAGADPTAAAP